MFDVEKTIRYLKENKAHHISKIQDYIQCPSIPSDEKNVRKCAALLVDYFKDLGCEEAEIVETTGLPGVWAYYNAGAKKTIVNYGNFDVRAIIDESKWTYPPFEGKLVKMEPYQEVIIGRGARSYKGPYMAWLNALETLIKVHGNLPVNIMFLLEGDENIGSPTYHEMFNQYRNQLKTADACFAPGVSQDRQGNVNLTLGFKAFVPFWLKATGKAWGRGPQTGPAHGMAKSILDSPVWHLIHALASMTEDNGNKISIKNFYDNVPAVTDEERAEVERLRAVLGQKPWFELLPGVRGGARVVSGNMSERDIFAQYLYGASLNINILEAGDKGPEPKAYSLPHEARCRIDMRLPRGASTKKALSAIRQELTGRGFEDIEVDVIAAYEAYQTDRTSKLVSSIYQVFERREVPVITWPYTGGGGPWSLYATEFGIPVVRDVGLGFGGNVGGPDEYLVIDGGREGSGLIDCELSHIEMLMGYAEA